jgi:hypothetical protein
MTYKAMARNSRIYRLPLRLITPSWSDGALHGLAISPRPYVAAVKRKAEGIGVIQLQIKASLLK